MDDFKSISLVTDPEISLKLFGALPTDLYRLKSVDGLEPPAVDVSIGNTLYQGGVYQNRRPQLRTLVFNAVLNPNYSAGEVPADLRKPIYEAMTLTPLGEALRILLKDGTAATIAQTDGYIHRVVPAFFSNEPGIQITVPTTSAYLSAPADVDTGNVSTISIVINNDGDAPSGFKTEVTFSGAASNFRLTKINPVGDDPFMLVTHSFISGDKLTIDTRPGSKSISLLRSGVTSDLIGKLSDDSDWLLLNGKFNSFTNFGAPTATVKITYRPLYWGV